MTIFMQLLNVIYIMCLICCLYQLIFCLHRSCDRVAQCQNSYKRFRSGCSITESWGFQFRL